MSSQPVAAGAPEASATIVPRWEWRQFGDIQARLEETGPERVQESDELYLLSPVSDASVKVRDGLMDVKRLQRVDEHGLEQWLPVLKAPFPLTPDGVSVVARALEMPAPETAKLSLSAYKRCS